MIDNSAPTLETQRLRLDPLRVEDADEMAAVLADPSLYAFTGGEPPSVEALRRRYVAQVVGRSGDGRERWLNWIVRVRIDRTAVGFVQATVGEQGIADVAWVIGLPWQGRGYATETAIALIAWLRASGRVTAITAHIHPDHAASARVAERAGLERTDEIDDGEIVWRSPDPIASRQR